MLCENCGEKEAVIHLTQIQNNTVTNSHLCEACAAEKGVETGASVAKFPLGDFLASLGKGVAAETGEAGQDISCPSCRGTLRDFRQTGRLGCAHCYETFGTQLRDLLRRLHGHAVHVGETYRAPAARPARVAGSKRELGELKEQLRRAIESENFELAAELRDRIRVLE